jgi:hypothetical protein
MAQRRTWLAGVGPAPDAQRVRDDQGRVWTKEGGEYHTADNRQHHTAEELHARTDLSEAG